jgi:hypothetical protein
MAEQPGPTKGIDGLSRADGSTKSRPVHFDSPEAGMHTCNAVHDLRSDLSERGLDFPTYVVEVCKLIGTDLRASRDF